MYQNRIKSTFNFELKKSSFLDKNLEGPSKKDSQAILETNFQINKSYMQGDLFSMENTIKKCKDSISLNVCYNLGLKKTGWRLHGHFNTIDKYEPDFREIWGVGQFQNFEFLLDLRNDSLSDNQSSMGFLKRSSCQFITHFSPSLINSNSDKDDNDSKNVSTKSNILSLKL